MSIPAGLREQLKARLRRIAVGEFTGDVPSASGGGAPGMPKLPGGQGAAAPGRQSLAPRIAPPPAGSVRPIAPSPPGPTSMPTPAPAPMPTPAPAPMPTPAPAPMPTPAPAPMPAPAPGTRIAPPGGPGQVAAPPAPVSPSAPSTPPLKRLVPRKSAGDPNPDDLMNMSVEEFRAYLRKERNAREETKKRKSDATAKAALYSNDDRLEAAWDQLDVEERRHWIKMIDERKRDAASDSEDPDAETAAKKTSSETEDTDSRYTVGGENSGYEPYGMSAPADSSKNDILEEETNTSDIKANAGFLRDEANVRREEKSDRPGYDITDVQAKAPDKAAIDLETAYRMPGMKSDIEAGLKRAGFELEAVFDEKGKVSSPAIARLLKSTLDATKMKSWVLYGKEAARAEKYKERQANVTRAMDPATGGFFYKAPGSSQVKWYGHGDPNRANIGEARMDTYLQGATAANQRALAQIYFSNGGQLDTTQAKSWANPGVATMNEDARTALTNWHDTYMTSRDAFSRELRDRITTALTVGEMMRGVAPQVDSANRVASRGFGSVPLEKWTARHNPAPLQASPQQQAQWTAQHAKVKATAPPPPRWSSQKQAQWLADHRTPKDVWPPMPPPSGNPITHAPQASPIEKSDYSVPEAGRSPITTPAHGEAAEAIVKKNPGTAGRERDKPVVYGGPQDG